MVYNLSKGKNKRRITHGDFELVVDVLGNPTRRQIIRKLSEGPEYTLKLSNELNIGQQLASKHLKVIREAELVDVIREKSRKGADKNVFRLNKFYSLQIDFSPSLYNERLISFNNPTQWIQQDNYMERLEEKVQDIQEDEPDLETINPLGQIIHTIDEELEVLEKRRARLLYIRNLAVSATRDALGEVERRKQRLVSYIVDKGPTSIESLSRAFKLGDKTVRHIVSDLENEDLVRRENNIIHLKNYL